MSRTQQATEMMASAPIFPPSFDDSPYMFGWALFARLLVLTLSAATIVRLLSLLRTEHVSPDHPVFAQRAILICFMSALLLGSGSDVLTWLAWGEVEGSTMGLALAASRVLDGMTMVPFLLGLFAPYWMRSLRRYGIVRPGYIMEQGPSDTRTTWGRVAVPVKLSLLCAVGALVVTLTKYTVWMAKYANG